MYYNHGQKSWDKFALLLLLRTRQTWILLHLPNLAPHPPYNVENNYLQFLLIFNIILGGDGGQWHIFKRKAALFSNSINKTHITLKLHKCFKDFCPWFSDFHVLWKNAQLECFIAVKAFRTRECEHLRLERHLSELLHSFSTFYNSFGPTLKTFVCDGSDNSIAWFVSVTNCLHCTVQFCRYFKYLNDKFGI